MDRKKNMEDEINMRKAGASRLYRIVRNERNWEAAR